MSDRRHKIVYRDISDLKPYRGNARTHSAKQIRQSADSITAFGFNNPVLIGSDSEIIAGHGRVAAALLLGLTDVPTLKLAHLSAAERRAYILADNKLALNAGWDTEILAIELDALIKLEVDVSLTGFSLPEVDLILDIETQASISSPTADEDLVPPEGEVLVSKPGDLWQLDRHLLMCGDAREKEHYDLLMRGDRANIMFTDPPYNVRVDGHVCGLGRISHREFPMASGEMSCSEYAAFLTTTLGLGAAHCGDGAIAFVCMDWRHMGELLEAGAMAFGELKNLCVWNKSNGGMGTFYRSKHELVFVFKIGTAPHINNFGLGEGGRYRTNVWDYPGMNARSSSRAEALSMHPTVKPTAMVADALRDCSHRGDIVLDPFAGSGTTLIAAQISGRIARLLELDPVYCDTIIRRFTKLTGKPATLVSSGERFDEIEDWLLREKR